MDNKLRNVLMHMLVVAFTLRSMGVLVQTFEFRMWNQVKLHIYIYVCMHTCRYTKPAKIHVHI